MFKKTFLLFLAVSLSVSLGPTAGTATPGQTPSRVSFAANGQQLNDAVGRGVALADFNGDGALDAFTVNEEGRKSRCRLYLGDGKGRFADTGRSWEAPLLIAKPFVMDVNGDGRMDVVTGRTIWINDGKGEFSADASRLPDSGGAMYWNCRKGDLNKDGVDDVLVVTMADGVTRGLAYLNDGKGHFEPYGQPFGQNILSGIELGDVNGDGALDVVVSGWRNAPADPCPNRVYFNDGKGAFSDSGQIFDEGTRHSHGLALGDLDKDGDLDLVLVTQAPPHARLYFNDGKGVFTSGRTLGEGGPEKVAVVDLNGDGAPDIFLACHGPNEVWLGDGKGGFADSGLRLGKDWSWEYAVGDFNKDGLPDLFLVDLEADFNAPPEKMMQARCAEIWINTTKTKRS